MPKRNGGKNLQYCTAFIWCGGGKIEMILKLKLPY